MARVVRRDEPGQSLRPSERRRGVRFPVDTPATCIIAGSSAVDDVRILDVSKDGMKIQIREFCKPGAILAIRLRNVTVIAEVCYCTPAKVGFHAGIRIRELLQGSL